MNQHNVAFLTSDIHRQAAKYIIERSQLNKKYRFLSDRRDTLILTVNEVTYNVAAHDPKGINGLIKDIQNMFFHIANKMLAEENINNQEQIILSSLKIQL